MLTMTFNTTRSILIEPGASRRLAEHVRGLGGRKALLVTDAGVVAAGLLDATLAGFQGSGVEIELFTEVVADPPEAVILAAVRTARACAADCVIGFGGGSSLDAAKLAALLACSGESLAEV